MTISNVETTLLESVADVTTDREAFPKCWIAVFVQVCTEKKVGEKLCRIGIENYARLNWKYINGAIERKNRTYSHANGGICLYR